MGNKYVSKWTNERDYQMRMHVATINSRCLSGREVIYKNSPGKITDLNEWHEFPANVMTVTASGGGEHVTVTRNIKNWVFNDGAERQEAEKYCRDDMLDGVGCNNEDAAKQCFGKATLAACKAACDPATGCNGVSYWPLPDTNGYHPGQCVKCTSKKKGDDLSDHNEWRTYWLSTDPSSFQTNVDLLKQYNRCPGCRMRLSVEGEASTGSTIHVNLRHTTNGGDYPYLSSTIGFPSVPIDFTPQIPSDGTASMSKLRISFSLVPSVNIGWGWWFILRKITLYVVHECAEATYDKFLLVPGPGNDDYSLDLTPASPSWSVGQHFSRSPTVRTTFDDGTWLRNGAKFSTTDKDNDGSIHECATRDDGSARGGWWYAPASHKFFDNNIGKGSVIGYFEDAGAADRYESGSNFLERLPAHLEPSDVAIEACVTCSAGQTVCVEFLPSKAIFDYFQSGVQSAWQPLGPVVATKGTPTKIPTGLWTGDPNPNSTNKGWLIRTGPDYVCGQTFAASYGFNTCGDSCDGSPISNAFTARASLAWVPKTCQHGSMTGVYPSPPARTVMPATPGDAVTAPHALGGYWSSMQTMEMMIKPTNPYGGGDRIVATCEDLASISADCAKRCVERPSTGGQHPAGVWCPTAAAISPKRSEENSRYTHVWHVAPDGDGRPRRRQRGQAYGDDLRGRRKRGAGRLDSFESRSVPGRRRRLVQVVHGGCRFGRTGGASCTRRRGTLAVPPSAWFLCRSDPTCEYAAFRADLQRCRQTSESMCSIVPLL